MRKERRLPNTRDGRAVLSGLVNEAAGVFLLDNPLLEKVASGEIGPEGWKAFAAQRFLAALPFEKLLVACKEAAAKAGDRRLEGAIVGNLRDEMGMNEKGETTPDRSHAAWRADFYAALGIDQDRLAAAAPTAGTRAYRAALDELLQSGDALVMAGGILALEGTIPREFSRIRSGRDAVFPEIFVEHPGDSDDEKRTKAKARLYLDDHILHDARSNYPDLLSALEPRAAIPEELARMKTGVTVIAEAKKGFYAHQ